MEVLVASIPALIAAVVSLITFFSNKNNSILNTVKALEERQIAMENSLDYERAAQARTRILRFNNEIMCGYRHTKDSFDDVIQNSIDVYEKYYNDPKHVNLKNGIAKSAIKNIYRVYDYNVQHNSFLQYPKEGE
jgi:putative IMPACT (imprinted ancient) family translation regulator